MHRFVVTRPFPESNIGSNLASLAGAAWIAERLRRPLVVDWRGLSQLADKTANYFTEFFEPSERLGDVSIRYAPASDVADYGREHAAWLSPAEARAAAVSGEAPDAMVLQTYHGLDRVHPGPEAERFRINRSFYREIGPKAQIRAEAESWWREHLEGAFVVGVNVRTGNGQYFGKGAAYASRVDVSVFENRQRFLRVLERACRARLARLPRPFRDDFAIFYATDSAWMSELLSELPNAVTRRGVFPPPGSGDTFCFPAAGPYSDRDSVTDTLVDMFLLARCDAFVFNSSLFNQYARVMNGNFGGNQVHIESLFFGLRARQLARRLQRGVTRLR